MLSEQDHLLWKWCIYTWIYFFWFLGSKTFSSQHYIHKQKKKEIIPLLWSWQWCNSCLLVHFTEDFILSREPFENHSWAFKNFPGQEMTELGSRSPITWTSNCIFEAWRDLQLPSFEEERNFAPASENTANNAQTCWPTVLLVVGGIRVKL